MARDAIAITALNRDAVTAAATGTSITAANGCTIAAGGDTDNLLLEVTHTAASEKDLTIPAGTGPRSSLGGIETAFAAGNVTPVVKYYVLESARFAQADGAIHVDFESGFTGTARVYRLPPGF